jgi:hypothetical protein
MGQTSSIRCLLRVGEYGALWERWADLFMASMGIDNIPRVIRAYLNQLPSSL